MISNHSHFDPVSFPNPDDDYAPVPPETAAEKELIDALIKAAEEAMRRARPIPNPDPTTEPEPTTQPTAFPTPPIILPTATPEPHKQISLGLNEDPTTHRALLPIFTYYLNQKLNPENIFVYDYGDWISKGLATTYEPFEPRFLEAAQNAEHIHFNLEGIRGDPVEFAETLGRTGFETGNYTAAELYNIRHSTGWCAKTSFYTEGSINVMVESLEMKAKICTLP